MILVKVKLDEGAIWPEKAHRQDAGYDLFSRDEKVIPAGESAVFDTGVHIGLPEGYVGMIKSKSGLNVKHGLTSEGVIDAGYTGSIRVKLYNHSDEFYHVYKGDKISQIVIIACESIGMCEVDEMDETERGSRGFGSSGR